MPDQDRTNVHPLSAYSAGEVFADIRRMRERVIRAWRERAVMLTREEQARLHQEITDTCELLTELTKP